MSAAMQATEPLFTREEMFADEMRERVMALREPTPNRPPPCEYDADGDPLDFAAYRAERLWRAVDRYRYDNLWALRDQLDRSLAANMDWRVARTRFDPQDLCCRMEHKPRHMNTYAYRLEWRRVHGKDVQLVFDHTTCFRVGSKPAAILAHPYAPEEDLEEALIRMSCWWEVLPWSWHSPDTATAVLVVQ